MSNENETMEQIEKMKVLNQNLSILLGNALTNNEELNNQIMDLTLKTVKKMKALTSKM
jgi:hypothetical protein